MQVALPDIAAAERLGTAIAARVRGGDVIALSGGLGAGKTTLARAILRALGHDGEVPSPSFAIFEVYDGAAMRVPAVHADFYRLANPAEVEELGIDDYRDDAVLIAEWPEQAGGFTGEPACLAITLVPVRTDEESADSGRIAIVEGGADWLGRMP